MSLKLIIPEFNLWVLSRNRMYLRKPFSKNGQTSIGLVSYRTSFQIPVLYRKYYGQTLAVRIYSYQSYNNNTMDNCLEYDSRFVIFIVNHKKLGNRVQSL